jgi:hypothetical protein
MGFPASASLCLEVGDAVEIPVKAANSETVMRLNIMLIQAVATYLRRPPCPDHPNRPRLCIYRGLRQHASTTGCQQSNVQVSVKALGNARDYGRAAHHYSSIFRLTVPFPMSMSVSMLSMSGRIGKECNQLTFTSHRNLRVTFQNSLPPCQPILIYLRDDGLHLIIASADILRVVGWPGVFIPKALGRRIK